MTNLALGGRFIYKNLGYREYNAAVLKGGVPLDYFKTDFDVLTCDLDFCSYYESFLIPLTNDSWREKVENGILPVQFSGKNAKSLIVEIPLKHF